MTPLERELTPGQEHAYRIPCEPGQLLHVVVEQRGIDLVVIVSSPNGRELVRVDSPSGGYGPEAVRFVTASQGSYRLGIVASHRDGPSAGAKAVLASLWRVDDVATARLMEVFYRGLLREGLRPTAALRAAQLDLSSTKRWGSPYYWRVLSCKATGNEREFPLAVDRSGL